jgi:hypothetical protein
MLRIALLLAGTALLIVLLWRLGLSEILNLLSHVGWYGFPIVMLYAGHHASRAFALRLCVLKPEQLGYGDAVAIRLSGEAIQSLTVTGPLLAEPTRAWLLERRGFTLQEGFAATLTEYLVSSFVIAGMSIIGLVVLIRRFEPPPVVTATAICIIVLFSAFLVASLIAVRRGFYLIGTIIAALGRAGVLRGRLRPDMTWINRMEDLLLAVLRDRPIRVFAIALIEVAAQALLVLELFWLMQALEMSPEPFTAFIIESSAKVIGIAFLFIPLQIGVSEGAYALIFNVMGLPATAGFALAFLRRLRSLAIASLGLALFAHLTRRIRNP